MRKCQGKRWRELEREREREEHLIFPSKINSPMRYMVSGIGRERREGVKVKVEGIEVILSFHRRTVISVSWYRFRWRVKKASGAGIKDGCSDFPHGQLTHMRHIGSFVRYSLITQVLSTAYPTISEESNINNVANLQTGICASPTMLLNTFITEICLPTFKRS